MTCVMVRPDCEECATYARCDGDCGELHYMIARMVADDEGHEAWHRAHHCPQCGRPKQHADGSPDDVTRLCEYGNCVVWFCPGCDYERGGNGPALCPCSASWWTRTYFRVTGWFDRLRRYQ